MEHSKYYFLKLTDTYFDTTQMRLLEGMNQGEQNICLLLKLYLRSLNTGGRLVLDNGKPLSEKDMAALLHKPIKRIQQAFSQYESVGLVSQGENGEWRLKNLEQYVGRSSREADRKAKSRMEPMPWEL